MPETQRSFPPLPFTAVTSAATMNTMNGVVEEEEEDHFDRLPDVLIVSIFNKLVHAKYLFRCFAVCKRFASLIRQTDTIFISIGFPKIPNPISVLFQHIVNIPLRIFHRILPAAQSSPSSSSLSSSIDSHCAPPRAIIGLMKFTWVRSLQIEIPIPPSNNSEKSLCSPWVKFKAVIGARLDIAVSILTLDFHNMMEHFNGGATVPIDADDISAIMEQNNLQVIKGRLVNVLTNHKLAQTLIYRLPALCELVIDDQICGMLCMGREQIVELRNSGTPGVKSELSVSEVIGGNGVVGVKMKLELPSSGRWVIVAVVKPEDDEIVMERDVGVILEDACEHGDDDDDDGKTMDEVVNVVRNMMVSDQPDFSIKTHRLKLLED